MATYEFISLKCVSQNEIGGDEIFVEYVGEQVFPQAGFQARFRTGHAIVNRKAQLADTARANCLAVPGAHPVEEYDGVESFLRFDVPDHGLVIEVWEQDILTANDLMGKIVVFPTPTKGPVVKLLDKALTGVYELTYQVF